MKIVVFPLGCVITFAFSIPIVLAEVGPLSSKQKQEYATHIVTGTVQAIYSYDDTRRAGTVVDTRYVLEINITGIKKGKGLNKGEIVYARGWRAKRRPPNSVGASGHYIFPTKRGIGRPHLLSRGQNIRAFLQHRKNGGYDIVFPNGIEVLDAKNTN